MDQLQKCIEELNTKWSKDEISSEVLDYLPTWLEQFDEKDQLAVLEAVSQLDYVTHRDMGNFFHDIHQKVLTKFDEKDIIIVPVTQVKWEGNEWKHYSNTVKSGHLMQFLYIQYHPSLFQYKHNLDSPFKNETKKSYEEAKCIIFLDDFAGTGRTIEDFIKAFDDFYDLSAEVNKVLVCYNIMDPAFNLLQPYLTEIHSRKLIDLFSKISQAYGVDSAEVKDILKHYELGFHSNDSDEDFKYLFGYGQVAASVYFEHNVPNNNLAILWLGSFNNKINRHWVPLVFRHRNRDIKKRLYSQFLGMSKLRAEISYQNRILRRRDHV